MGFFDHSLAFYILQPRNSLRIILIELQKVEAKTEGIPHFSFFPVSTASPDRRRWFDGENKWGRGQTLNNFLVNHGGKPWNKELPIDLLSALAHSA